MEDLVSKYPEYFKSPRVLNFEVYWKERLIARVSADFNKQEVSFEQYTDVLVEKVFTTEKASISDLLDFLEFRCFPRTRVNCDQLLSDLGLTVYDPIEIVKRTHGLQFDDYMWIKFEGEDITYDSIKIRD